MNRGGHRGKSPRSAAHCSPVGARSDDTSIGNEIGSSQVGIARSEMTAVGGVTKKVGGMAASDRPHKLNSALRGGGDVTSNVGHGNIVQIMTPTFSDIQSPLGGERGKSAGRAESDGKLKYSTCQQKNSAFDICPGSSGFKLKRSLLEKNRERKKEMMNHIEGRNIDILKPGMVLLKGFLSLPDQVKIIKNCQDLGLGAGGFYQPGYSDGAKLHLKMMCLGKNWDPETGIYSDERPTDGAKPPGIPNEFQQLVKGAIQECHTHLESCAKVRNARDVLPTMSPDICIVNFYAESGRLGLHQDKDEKEGLQKRLPVVSFSIGDSAEFLYGDERNIDRAERVVLKSGDVLIFGGESRHIFHGVTTINPGTAPAALLEETNFRPGRLNLTFREY